MKLDVRFTSKFKKDVLRMKKQGKDLQKMYTVIERLASCQPLKPNQRDHQLGGNFSDFRECHITPDWLLIYKIENAQLILVLTRTGSHSELFK